MLCEMAASQDQFDSRFRQFVQSSVPTMDLISEQPLANQLLFEWQAV